MSIIAGPKVQKNTAFARGSAMRNKHSFNFSYWELQHYFDRFDLVIIGSGIVGLSAAISYKALYKKCRVLVLERGILPDGASTKNAGFACFGSAGELLDDLENMDADAVWNTVAMRYNGLQILRKRLGDKAMEYHNNGGFEVFTNAEDLELCLQKLDFLNKNISQILPIKKCFKAGKQNSFGFKKVKGIIQNPYEGQLNTGKMMEALRQLALNRGIEVLNNIKVSSFEEELQGLALNTSIGCLKCSKLLIATNGFASELLNLKDVKPARAQVLVTKPIKGLKIKGTFHFDKGYYYFRNINNRILFGGGRNLDFKKEETSKQELNKKIQRQLEKHLREMILPDQAFEIEHRWTGIMGVGNEKRPIIKRTGKNTVVAVRMGGMGIAIGSWVGKEAARLLSQG